MNDHAFPTSLDGLLGHGDFVRALAKSLLFDENQVDDVVQEAWLAALKAPPKSGNPKAWFATVTRNLVYDSRRRSRRLKAKEEAYAKPERLPSTSEIIEREAIRREIVEAVLSLEEPYQSTVLLRFYESLDPREIAELSSVPIETVYTRLRRGLEQLRDKLDRKHHRQAWCLSLIPLAIPKKTAALVASGGVAAWIHGVLLMSLKVKLGIVIGAMIVLGWSLWPKNSTPTASAEMALNVSQEKLANISEQKTGVTESADSTSRLLANPSTQCRIFGKVVNEKGEGLAGAKVRLKIKQVDIEKWSAQVVCNERGEYSVPLPALESSYSFTAFELIAKAEILDYWADKQALEFFLEEPPKEIKLNFAMKAGSVLAVRVMGAQGLPVSRASLDFDLLGKSGSHIRYPFGLSDEEGEYEYFLPDNKVLSEEINGGVVTAIHSEFGKASQEISPFGENTRQIIELALQPEASLEGRAIYPDGTPLANVELAAMLDSENYEEPFEWLSETEHKNRVAKTKADGSFRLRALDPGKYHLVISDFSKIVFTNPQTLYETNNSSILLTVASGRLLHIKVIDEEGKSIPAAGISYAVWRDPGEILKGRLLNRLLLPPFKELDSFVCAECSGQDVEGELSAGEWGSDFDISLSDGALVSYEVSATGAQAVRRIFEINAEKDKSEDIVVLKKIPARSSKLKLSVHEADGQPANDFFATLFWKDMADGPKGLNRCKGLNGELSLAAPPGHYRLRIERDKPRKTFCFPAELEVQLLPNEENKQELTFKEGGRIHMKISVSELLWKEHDINLLDLSARIYSAEGSQLAGAYPWFTAIPESESARNFVVYPSITLEPGTVYSSALLLPGRYSIRVQGKACRAEEKFVEVEAGKSVDVQLVLEKE